MQDGRRTFNLLMGLSVGTSLGVVLGLFGMPRLGVDGVAGTATGIAIGMVAGLALAIAMTAWKK